MHVCIQSTVVVKGNRCGLTGFKLPLDYEKSSDYLLQIHTIGGFTEIKKGLSKMTELDHRRKSWVL